MRLSVKAAAPFCVILAFIQVITQAQTGEKDIDKLIRKDRKLVVPGRGGEGVLIGEETSAAQGRLSGDNFTLSRFRIELDLYRDILKVESPHRIPFDRILFYPDLDTVLLSRKGCVNGIIGLNSMRITSDSVNLDKGLEYIIFNYGSESLVTLKKRKGTIYIYLNSGIAFIDDNSDNSLDMYILFKTEKQ